MDSLDRVKALRWTEFFRWDFPRCGCWWSLYKSSVDKRTGDIQWRIVHWAITTNTYLVHLDPSPWYNYTFSSQSVRQFTTWFGQCSRLEVLFRQLQSCFRGLSESFFCSLAIWLCSKGGYRPANFVSGTAELAICKTWVRGSGSEDIMSIMTGLVAARLRVDKGIFKWIVFAPSEKPLWTWSEFFENKGWREKIEGVKSMEDEGNVAIPFSNPDEGCLGMDHLRTQM